MQKQGVEIRYDNKGYDDTDPVSIENYAQKLVGKTFAQVCEEDSAAFVKDVEGNYEASHGNKNRKGGLGELIEERFFYYKCNNDSRPDFEKAGVELKVTPYKKNLNGSLVAKERLIITMIDYFTVLGETFEKSHLWSKAQLILLIYYLYQSDIENRLDYQIDFVKLFHVPKQDLLIMKQDFDIIVGKIKDGKAHELSEGDTMYLGAAPKAATSKDRRKQPYSMELAKPRAFAFKSSYMTYALNHYVVLGKTTYEPIIKIAVNENFETYVKGEINKYKDFSIDQLCNNFQISYEKPPKNIGALLTYRMLGIKGNHAEEFVKANIVIKTIRLDDNNRIAENMSFPTFKFKELLEETWDESVFGTYLSETKFLFVVYKVDKNREYRLKGCQFWNMPYQNLQEEVYLVWEKTRKVIREGLQVTQMNGKNYNNLPKEKENKVCHVRPHGRDSKDTYELPDGRQYTKQCFWLNRTYILSQLDENLLK